MTDNTIEVNQKSALGSETTQIALQQNTTYIGLPPEEVSKQMVALFMDNFPRLQQLAADKAIERVNELCGEILKRLEETRVTNFMPFSDPDVQYILCETEKNYARFGTKELLSMLSDLVVKRVKYDSDFLLKVVIDKAMLVVSSLSPNHLDLMSLLFLSKHIRFPEIKTLDALEDHLQYISRTFSGADVAAIPFLDTMDCTKIFLVDADKHYATTYGLNREDVQKVVPPKIMELLKGDYGLSYVGILLAIANTEAKTEYRFDPKIWISG